jgi:hypothetical protein
LRRRRGTHAAPLLLCTAVLLTACGGSDQHSVVVRRIAADLAFGTPPPQTAAPVRPASAPSVSAALPAPDLTSVLPPAAVGPIIRHLPPAAGLLCPTAAADAYPAEAATADINVEPVPGVYFFRWSGAQQLSIAGFSSKVPVPPVTRRTLHGVAAASDPTDSQSYTFEVDDPLNSTVARYLVRPFAGSITNPVPQPQPPDVPRQGLSVAAGVYLTHLAFKLDGATFTFDSPLGVQLLQLPVGNGAQWTSSVADTSDNSSITLNGVVAGHDRVDACGTVVDSWRVTGTLALSAPSAPITISDSVGFDIATQYGGLVVEEDHSYSSGVAGAADVSGTRYSGHLGGLTPQPLPDRMQ